MTVNHTATAWTLWLARSKVEYIQLDSIRGITSTRQDHIFIISFWQTNQKKSILHDTLRHGHLWTPLKSHYLMTKRVHYMYIMYVLWMYWIERVTFVGVDDISKCLPPLFKRRRAEPAKRKFRFKSSYRSFWKNLTTYFSRFHLGGFTKYFFFIA